MKETILSILLSIAILNYAKTQNVNIPDLNFKTYLLGNTAINTNGDTEIQSSEAIGFTGIIDCYNKSISDLTGIEAFVNVTELICSSNQLTSLDVSSNTDLTSLICYNNDLINLDVTSNTSLHTLRCNENSITSLNLSTNTNLKHLSCFLNELTDLDVSTNTLLETFSCSNNQITSLDVSNNPALTLLNCRNNNLTVLNIANGNNANLITMQATYNPNLDCIAQDPGFDPSVMQWWLKTFNTGWCNSTSLEPTKIKIKSKLNDEIKIFPNPSYDLITVECDLQLSAIEIFSINGEKVKSSNSNIFSIKELKSGIYIVKLISQNFSESKILIKKNN